MFNTLEILLFGSVSPLPINHVVSEEPPREAPEEEKAPISGDLGTRGLTGKKCLQCCEKAFTRSRLVLLQAAQWVKDNIAKPTQASPVIGETIQLVPMARLFPQPNTLRLFFVPLLGGLPAKEEMADFPQPSDEISADTLFGFANGIERALKRKQQEECPECVKKRLWGQGKARQWVFGKAGGKPQNLLIRVPHG